MKKRITVLLSSFACMLVLALVCAFGFTAVSADAATVGDGELIYFVNCGAELTTSMETGLGLESSGDIAYSAAEGYGYTEAGSATVGDNMESYRTGATYRFDLDGDYDLAVGTNGNATVTVNGGSPVTASESGITKIAVSGNITVAVDGNVNYIAVVSSGAKIMLNVQSESAEFLYYGSVVDSKATAYYSDGTTAEVGIVWSNLSANDVNTNFTMTEAIGTVEGTAVQVSRRFFTMPEGLVYFVNCGSFTGQPITAEANINDVYYNLNTAILNHYNAPTQSGKLLNAEPDQLYDGTWGYTAYHANYPVSSKQMPSKAGDPMPPLYPYNSIRSTDTASEGDGAMAYSIEYTLGGLDSATAYKLYVGTRSHWHARNVTPVLNGVEQNQFSIDAVAKITTYENVNPQGGSIKLKLQGKSLDEGNIAFIAIQTMEKANATATVVPEAPVRTENLGMGENTFTVSNVKAGTKVQVSLASGSYNILYEGMAEEDGDYEISVREGAFDGVFSLRIAAVNDAGASEYVTIYITDIQNYTFTPDITDWTTSDVTVAIHAEADSGIVRLVVTYEFVPTTIELDGDEIYNGTYTVGKNGVYEFTLYSGNNAFVSDTVEVNVIDRDDVSLSVDMATGGFADGKTAVRLTYAGAAQAANYTVYDTAGKKVTGGEGAPSSLSLDYGRYTLAVVSASGKTATASVIVSETPTYFTASASKSGGTSTYNIAGANGKEIKSFFAYGVDSSGNATRLMGSGMSFNEYSGNGVAIKVEYTDGTVEFARLAAAAEAKKKCGSAVAGSSIALAAVALAACATVIAVRRKKAVKSK